jgi:uncharacterized protein YjiK
MLEGRLLLSTVPFISEVHPSGSGNGTYAADWVEVTNTSATDLDITGWKLDDSSNAFATAVTLRGLTTIPAGKSAVFFEGNATGTTDATITAAFSNAWFGSPTLPAGFLIGAYGGAGVGLSTSGDAANLFDASGNLVTGVSFGAANAASTFDNKDGLGSATLPIPTISTLSTAGAGGAFLSSNGAETGSPGTIGALTGVDLSNYIRVGRFDLPEPTRTTPPVNSLLAQEVSAITYNWDTDTLFVVGDGGTSIVQVSKTGALIDSMTLAPGSSPQGTEFYDTEGLAYIGDGKFVLTEERDRQANLLTYVAGATLTRNDVQTVKLGTTIGNEGIEGLSYDPLTEGFILVKETQPQGVFQTDIDFVSGTATNGSPTTENSTNLFDPALANLVDFADVFALSNLSSLIGTETSHLLLLSQESGKVLNIDRSGTISSSLTIVSDPGNPLSVLDQGHEGLTMDNDGVLYVVNENGGGDINHPQLWVYARSAVPNQAPTALALNNRVNAIAENTSTATAIKVADVAITDDGLGTNTLSLSGADSGFFETIGNGLHIKVGTTLDFETKSSYSVTVNVDDATVGGTPDASAVFTLAVTDVVDETPSQADVVISEVTPWGSGDSPYSADWFEVKNNGTSPVDITGWKMDDNSNAFANAVALRGVMSIPAGKSAVFFEGNAPGSTDATIIAAFSMAWFGSATLPTGFLIGAYGGSGVGLSTGGDAVNLFDASGNRITGISFGASTTGFTFDNTAGLGSATLPLPAVSTLSVAGVNGAFLAADGIETGSPGGFVPPPSLIISEATPWASGNSPYAADWFEVTNTGRSTVDITGWKVDDNSNSFSSAVALRGVTSIGPGKSAVFLESDPLGSTDATIIAAFSTAWFGSATLPAGFLIGAYGGSGIGLGTGGDAVNLFDASGNRITGISFGASVNGFTFDNAAGLGSATLPLPAVSTLSVGGVNGAFLAADGSETGSPGSVHNNAPVAEVDDTTMAEDSTVTFNVLFNDTDADGNPLAITSFTAPSNGALASNGDGSFTYTPADNFNGTDSFAYAISDGRGGTAAATVNITVAAVNDAPVLTVPGPQTTVEDVAVRIKGIAVADSDAIEGENVIRITLSVTSGRIRVPVWAMDGLTAAHITGNSTRAVVLEGPIAAVNAILAKGLRYVGKLNFHGTDTLTVVADDLGNTGAGGRRTDSEPVSIRVLSPAEQIDRLQDMVEGLHDEGVISKGQTNALLKKLGHAEYSIAHGQLKVAYNVIVAFKHQVRAVLKPAQGKPLMIGAELLLQSLKTGMHVRKDLHKFRCDWPHSIHFTDHPGVWRSHDSRSHDSGKDRWPAALSMVRR